MNNILVDVVWKSVILISRACLLKLKRHFVPYLYLKLKELLNLVFVEYLARKTPIQDQFPSTFVSKWGQLFCLVAIIKNNLPANYGNAGENYYKCTNIDMQHA
jgi:hypothetical protein